MAKKTGRSTTAKKSAIVKEAETIKPEPTNVDSEIKKSIISGISKQMKRFPKSSAKYKKLVAKKKELQS